MSEILKPNPKYAMVVDLIFAKLPTYYSQAKIDKKWRETMTNEYNALLSDGTWTLVPSKSNMNIIGSTWVF